LDPGLVFPAETAEAAAGAAEAGPQHGQQQHPRSHAQAHPHPHDKFAVHLEGVLPVAGLQGLQAVAV